MYAATVASSLGHLTPEAKSLLVQSAQAEEIASEILWRKQLLVDLDRQRQECMQALATFRDQNKKSTKTASTDGSTSKSPSGSTSSTGSSTTVASTSTSSVPSALHAPPPSKLWVSFSSNFVKLPRSQVIQMLQADRTKLDEEITHVRQEMKEKMQQLQSVQQSLGIPKGLLDFALK